MVEHDQDAQTTSINVVDMPVVMRTQLSMIQVQKTVEVPQIQHVDKVVNMPVVIQRQVPMTLNLQKSVEVARVTPHERLLRPAGGGSSVRERARRFEEEWGAKHMATVEGPRNVQGDEQREHLESNLEQDACASVDESLGGLSLTHPRPEAADAELASREKQSHSLKGEASAQEREMEPPSKRRKQKSDPEPQIPMHFSLCDDSSDQVAKSVEARRTAERHHGRSERREEGADASQGAGRNSGPQRKVCRSEDGDCGQETEQIGEEKR